MRQWLVLAAALLASFAAGCWQMTPATAPATAGSSPVSAQRIVSASPVADAWLTELVPSSRVLAATAWFRAQHPWGWRVAGLAGTISSLDNVDAVLAMRPDVVIASDVGDVRRLDALRRAGLRVVDLGPSGDRRAMLQQLRILGDAIGAASTARMVAERITARLDRLTQRLPMEQRPLAVAVEILGSELSAFAAGSTHLSVLEAAGCRDASLGRWPAWSRITVEHLLAVQPQIIVTAHGSAARLRSLPGAQRLNARIIELPDAYLSAGGPLIADAAEWLHTLVFSSASR